MMSKFEILQSDRTDYELGRYNTYADDLTQIHLEKAIYNLLAYHITFSVFNYIKIIAYGIAGYIYFMGNISLADFFVIALSFRLLSNIL